MNNFIIGEVIKNSIGRDKEGHPIDEILFTVVTWQGRNFLYIGEFKEDEWQGKNRIAECVNGDYRKRYGGIKGWLKFLMKRANSRLNSLNERMKALQDEVDDLYDLKYKIEEVV